MNESFLMGTTSSITMQSFGKIALRAPAVGAKMWCLFYLSRSESGAPRAFEGCIVRTSIALLFIARFRRGLHHFFHKRFLFQMHYTVFIFVARWRHKFREIAVKNCEKSKNRRKSVFAPFRIDSWEIWRKFHGSSLGGYMSMCTYIKFFAHVAT